MREIDVADLEPALHDGATLVDVREAAEYAEGHVPGAVLLPMSQMSNRVGELDLSAEVHVICASGNRSAAICDFLTAAGLDAVNVTGGTAAWIRSGRLVEGGR